jgi:hypothetical protein
MCTTTSKKYACAKTDRDTFLSVSQLSAFLEGMPRHEALVLLLCVLGLWLCPQVRGYFTSVDAHAEECFFDRVSSGMKMSLTFEVVEGGFLDIDVKVYRRFRLLCWPSIKCVVFT